MKYLFGFLAIVLLFGGCTTKTPTKTQSALVTISTPSMKYNDLGFIKSYNDSVGLEIYSFGKALIDLRVYENKICSSTFKCMSSQQFVQEYIHPSYPKSFFNNIINFKELDDMNGISYQYEKENNLYYRDKENKILIKIVKGDL